MRICSVKDAFGRGYSRKRSECGARGREDTARSRAAWASSCRHYDRRVRCFTGLGQGGAGNARGAACAPRPEGRSKDHTLRPRPRKHGLTPSFGDESPFGESREWNAGRRAASREGGEPHRWVRRIRISVYRRSASFFSFPGAKGRSQSSSIDTERSRSEDLKIRSAEQKIAPRERIFISSLPGLTRQSMRPRSLFRFSARSR